jgi:hypothetical protein
MSTYSHPALTPSFMSSKIASCASSGHMPPCDAVRLSADGKAPTQPQVPDYDYVARQLAALRQRSTLPTATPSGR